MEECGLPFIVLPAEDYGNVYVHCPACPRAVFAAMLIGVSLPLPIRSVIGYALPTHF